MQLSTVMRFAAAAAVTAAGVIGTSFAGQPTADALPIGGPSLPFAPVDGYVMGDSGACFIDYKSWIDRDSAQPWRVVAHFEPRGVRATIPGLPAPTGCSATVVPFTATNIDLVSHPIGPNSIDNGLAGLLGGPVQHLGSSPIQFDLPYQPDATGVMATLVPQANLYPFAGLVAQPLVGPFTAFALR